MQRPGAEVCLAYLTSTIVARMVGAEWAKRREVGRWDREVMGFIDLGIDICFYFE